MSLKGEKKKENKSNTNKERNWKKTKQNQPGQQTSFGVSSWTQNMET